MCAAVLWRLSRHAWVWLDDQCNIRMTKPHTRTSGEAFPTIMPKIKYRSTYCKFQSNSQTPFKATIVIMPYAMQCRRLTRVIGHMHNSLWTVNILLHGCSHSLQSSSCVRLQHLGWSLFWLEGIVEAWLLQLLDAPKFVEVTSNLMTSLCGSALYFKSGLPDRYVWWALSADSVPGKWLPTSPSSPSTFTSAAPIGADCNTAEKSASNVVNAHITLLLLQHVSAKIFDKHTCLLTTQARFICLALSLRSQWFLDITAFTIINWSAPWASTMVHFSTGCISIQLLYVRSWTPLASSRPYTTSAFESKKGKPICIPDTGFSTCAWDASLPASLPATDFPSRIVTWSSETSALSCAESLASRLQVCASALSAAILLLRFSLRQMYVNVSVIYCIDQCHCRISKVAVMRDLIKKKNRIWQSN